MKRKIIAVTGGIGSGKSAVICILRNMGYDTLDCDDLAREVSARADVVERVGNLLGSEFVTNGRLNRSAIRSKVFADSEILQRYNGIFFGETRKLLSERIDGLNRRAADNSPIFVEISVFDAFTFDWDAVWLVECGLSERKRRVMERDGVSAQNVDDVISRQKICSEYTLTIVNDGSLELLETSVENALEQTLHHQY